MSRTSGPDRGPGGEVLVQRPPADRLAQPELEHEVGGAPEVGVARDGRHRVADDVARDQADLGRDAVRGQDLLALDGHHRGPDVEAAQLGEGADGQVDARVDEADELALAEPEAPLVVVDRRHPHRADRDDDEQHDERDGDEPEEPFHERHPAV